jgi:hypothetical protein
MSVDTVQTTLSVEEAIIRFPWEWIFMRVTAKNEHQTPSHGVVISHHPKRGVRQTWILKTVAPEWGKEAEYYEFFAHPMIHSGEEWVRTLDRQIQIGS